EEPLPAPEPSRTQGLALAEQGRVLVTSAWGSDRVHILDLKSGKIRASRVVDRFPTQVAVAARSGEAWVACYDPGTVHVIDVATGEPRGRIDLSEGMYGVALSPDERRAYAAGSQFLHELDARTRR